MDRRIIALYDEYTHAPLPRRVFLQRLAEITGGTAAALAVLPHIENNYARAALVDPDDGRLDAGFASYPGVTGDVRAYLAVPKAKTRPSGKKPANEKRAGVIVIHENRGLNPHIQDVTRRVALAGYTALAPDMLSPLGGTPENEDEARAGFGKLDRGETVKNLVAAVAYLKARSDANGKVGVVGFCWGGGMTGLLAVNAPDLAAAVSFYGSVPPSDGVPKIKAKLLMHFAGNDARINAGIADFEAAAQAAKLTYEKYVYEGTEHAFHNDTAGARYNKEAAELAWSRTLDFFAKHLGK